MLMQTFTIFVCAVLLACGMHLLLYDLFETFDIISMDFKHHTVSKPKHKMCERLFIF